MKKLFLVRLFCFISALLFLFAFAGCSKKDDEADVGVVVERTFGEPTAPVAPVVTPDPIPEPSDDIEDDSDKIVLSDGAETLAYINADEVNVREINSTTGNVLGKLAAGSVISVINRDYGNGWSQIDYNGITAFMATQYITNITTEKTIPIECMAKVNSSDVNMRADSTTDALIIGKLADGTEVEIIKKDAGHNWSMVLYDSKVAFVSSRYLTFDETV